MQGERISLNLLARASGIASRAYFVSQRAKKLNWTGFLAGTRKTTPGFRWIEKYALIIGGCDPHRYDLSSMVMLKDNHIWSSGSIKLAVERAQNVCGFSLKIEVECQTEDEADQAIKAGAHIVMLDNFNPSDLHSCALSLKLKHGKNVLIEASGGIDIDNLDEYFDPNIDIISLGSLTQSVPHIDFSLKINRNSV